MKPPPLANPRMSQGIDAAEHAVQATGCDRVVDSAISEPQGPHLRTRNHSVLCVGELYEALAPSAASFP